MHKIVKKLSIDEQLMKSKKEQRYLKFLNSIINIPLFGEKVFNCKESKNIFDINNILISKRSEVNIQNEYGEELLKATTPNFRTGCKTFNFNSDKRIGWIITEFDLQSNLTQKDNITYIRKHIQSRIGFEPTLVAIQEDTILVGYLFPNNPTISKKHSLDKYHYFSDVRTALTHSLKANWDVTVDTYNQTKTYSNVLENNFYLSGDIFEIGMFQEMLDDYKETPMFKKIISQKKAFGGYKAGISKRAMSSKKRRELTLSATRKRAVIAKGKLKEVIRHIIKTEKEPNFSIRHIVLVSKEIFDKGICSKTVAKYFKIYKKRYLRFINRKYQL
jgi:hypothetical protein